MSIYKVIVAGSRDFDDYKLLETSMIHFFHGKYPENVEIISGADWDKHGKRAGHIRNYDMAKYANACVVFWDGKSKGTKSMINMAKREELDLKIIRY